MMSFFKRNKQPVANKAIDKISGVINGKAKQLATYLNSRAARISRRNMKLLLVVFCIYWGGYSLYVGVKAFWHQGNDIHVTAISVPKQVNDAPAPDTVTLNALKRIKAFKKYMDSLQVHDIATYNRITLQRPGLMDSIAVIERYYPFNH
jgi:hypothetical protein